MTEEATRAENADAIEREIYDAAIKAVVEIPLLKQEMEAVKKDIEDLYVRIGTEVHELGRRIDDLRLRYHTHGGSHVP